MILADEVLASHQQAMVDRYVTSVVPEVAGIEIDPDVITGMVANVVTESFSRKGVIRGNPVNHLSRSKFTFLDGDVDIRFADGVSTSQREMAEAAGELLKPIDDHFRLLAGLAPDVPTTPIVNLLAGVFSGRNPTDTNRHFDYRRRLAVIQYKMCYLGDHTSLYYPGNYRLPTLGTGLSRAFGGSSNPEAPTPLFKRKDEVVHSMPPRVVCVEPWNAYHSGPTDKKARGTLRGVLGVTYDLAKLPIKKLEAVN